jgi:hypothetical protein
LMARIGGEARARRAARKTLQRLLTRSYDVSRFPSFARRRVLAGQAILMGVGGASLIYGVVFSLGWYAQAQGVLDQEIFVKVTWMLMVPASVIGFLAWAIAKGRGEYKLRKESAEYIAEIEGTQGLIWRFAPLIGTRNARDGEICEKSRQGDIGEREAEEYAEMVRRLFDLTRTEDAGELDIDAVRLVSENFSRPRGGAPGLFKESRNSQPV